MKNPNKVWSNRSSRGTKDKRQSAVEEKNLSIHKVGTTSSGNILVEMTPKAWERICATGTRADIDLGAEICEFRNRHRISQTEFAQMIGCSRNWVSILERDGAVKLSYESLKRILSIVRG